MVNVPVFDTQMTDAEALMWRMEQDPHLSSTFASVTVLDRPADYGALRRRMERASWVIRRLRQRVHPGSGPLQGPVWEEDPDFDIDLHVRHLALPSPGTLRQLLDLATLLAGDPFDRTRPLWQFYVVDGLQGGKGALVQKMHHTIADGEASLAMSLQYLDFERDAPQPAPLDPGMLGDAADEAESSGRPSNVLQDLAAAGWKVPLGIAKQLRDLLTHPGSLPNAGDELRELIGALRRPPRTASALWTERSLRRRMEVLQVGLDETKAAATALGGTLNTAFLTAAADAAGRYHRAMGEPVESLFASMAVSTRTSGSGGNAFSLARFEVPTGEMPVGERFGTIVERTSVAKSATTGLDGLAALVAAIPTPVLARVARQQSQSVDFATSNVRAAPVKVYIAGGAIEANYPVGPLLGVAFNATLMSYHGQLYVGVNCDTAAVTDPGLLGTSLQAAFAEVIAAGRPTTTRRARGTTPVSSRREARSAGSGRPARRR